MKTSRRGQTETNLRLIGLITLVGVHAHPVCSVLLVSWRVRRCLQIKNSITPDKAETRDRLEYRRQGLLLIPKSAVNNQTTHFMHRFYNHQGAAKDVTNGAHVRETQSFDNMNVGIRHKPIECC